MHQNKVLCTRNRGYIIKIAKVKASRLCSTDAIPEKSDKYKYDVIVDAWLGQIVDIGCEIGIVLFTQIMPAIKLYPV